MSVAEILNGESVNVEYKARVPEKSLNYMKTVVAFANGFGGRLVFGVADGTREIVGVDEADVFKMMDAIANAISDSCEPAIVPDIMLQTIAGKTVIVVDVLPGGQRPYFIKSLGLNGGVYIRVAGTTRPADRYMVRELLFEGSNRSFDQAICSGLTVSEDDIDALCRAMQEEARRNARSDEQRVAIKNVGRGQLLSWGILAEKDGMALATNAYAILTGNVAVPPAMIQCGVFKGKTRAVFVDRREYGGPIWEQIEQAYQFVLRNIHLGAEFDGLYRQDVYEIPPEAIRELIINAAVHRSYLDHGAIQVAIYDDRLEVTSPGKLPMGQTLERMQEGYSKIRNEALAYAFSYMNLIEHWGSGIPRVTSQVMAAGLRAPEFIGGDVDLRINVYRRKIGVVLAENDTLESADDTLAVKNDTLEDGGDTLALENDTLESADDTLASENDEALETKLLALIREDPHLTQQQLAERLNVSVITVKRLMTHLQEHAQIKRVGSKRYGQWIILREK